MNTLKKYALLLALACSSNVHPEGQDSLFAPEKESKASGSKQDLKETLATQVKDALHESARVLSSLSTQMQAIKVEKGQDATQPALEVIKLIGSILSRISNVQQGLFTTIEHLMDNAFPFKKATKEELAEAIRIVQETTTYLRKIEKEFCGSEKGALLKAKNSTLVTLSSTLCTIEKNFNSSPCLKLVA
jgi:hypothetical protein